jgi:DNA-binding CsgD family transcriptional regulator
MAMAKTAEGNPLPLVSPTMTGQPIGQLAYSRGNRESDNTDSASPYPFAVDLVGPSLLLQGLADLLFGFAEVACVRLLSPQVNVTNHKRVERSFTLSPSTTTEATNHVLPLTRLLPATVALGVYWHECASESVGSSLAPCCVVLFGRHASLRKPLPLVSLSLYDDPQTLCDGLRSAATEQSYCSSRLKRSLSPPVRVPAQPARSVALSEREYEIALLVADGLTNEEIARELFLGVSTIKTHLVSVFSKLGVDRRAHVRAALEQTGMPHSSLVSLPYEEINCFTKAGYELSAIMDNDLVP